MAGNCQCGRAYRRLIWGFGFAPADYQQGNSYRIITCMCLRRSGRWAFMHQWQWRVYWPCLADENGQPGGGGDGPIGAVFTFIALVTGSAWGKPCGAPGGYGMHV